MNLDIYFDGACEDVNPGGHMGWGIAVVIEGLVLWTESGYEAAGPQTSNNVAEYLGAITALECAKWVVDVHLAIKAHQPFGPVPPAIVAVAQRETLEITLWGDSKLVIEQLSGRWKVRSGGHYVKHMHAAKKLLADLQGVPGVTIAMRWLPDTQNVYADKASRRELESRGIKRRKRP